jgi:hypothetical protein
MNPPTFISGHGKSGTKWIAMVLNAADGCTAYHELGEEKNNWEIFNKHKNGERSNCWSEHTVFVNNRMKKTDVFVESNSYLRFSYKEIRRSFPKGALVAHTVRDGRNVVRSCCPSDSLETFEEECVEWKDSIEHLLNTPIPWFRFEGIINSFDYFNVTLAFPIDISIPREIWELFSKERINSKQKKIPHWRYWEKERTQLFDKHCKELMQHIGYRY